MSVPSYPKLVFDFKSDSENPICILFGTSNTTLLGSALVGIGHLQNGVEGSLIREFKTVIPTDLTRFCKEHQIW